MLKVEVNFFEASTGSNSPIGYESLHLGESVSSLIGSSFSKANVIPFIPYMTSSVNFLRGFTFSFLFPFFFPFLFLSFIVNKYFLSCPCQIHEPYYFSLLPSVLFSYTLNHYSQIFLCIGIT